MTTVAPACDLRSSRSVKQVSEQVAILASIDDDSFFAMAPLHSEVDAWLAAVAGTCYSARVQVNECPCAVVARYAVRQACFGANAQRGAVEG
jgi:hypothetical protein